MLVRWEQEEAVVFHVDDDGVEVHEDDDDDGDGYVNIDNVSRADAANGLVREPFILLTINLMLRRLDN